MIITAAISLKAKLRESPVVPGARFCYRKITILDVVVPFVDGAVFSERWTTKAVR